MTITANLVLLIVAIVLFFIGAILAFRWFGTSSPEDALGYVSLGLIGFTAAHLPLSRVP